MSSEKQGGGAGWVQIIIALIGVVGAIAVAWITMPVKFQGTVGQGKADPAPEPGEPARAKPTVEAPTVPTQPASPSSTPTKPATPTPKADKAAPPSTTPPALAARNPFGVKDVFGVDGADVKLFAASVRSIAGQNEPNAPQWAGPPVAGVRGSVEGEWTSRWRSGATQPWQVGKATLREIGGRVFILFRDPAPTYLIEAVRDGKTRLVGRYVNLKFPKEDNSPWVGEIFGDERIDGKWSDGRWDLRRQLR